MDRMACVNLPAFPLQLLVQQHPDWKELPAAVVDKDKPQGVIQWVNKRALHYRILPGMRYAKGLSLSPDLRAGEVPEADVTKHIDQLIELFRFYTPNVEPSSDEPGVFWLDATGLTPLNESLGKWAGLIGDDLTKMGFYWSISVGFSRYGSYAIAKSSKGINILSSDIKERARARSVPIVRLGVEPNLRDSLAQLNITTLGGFMDLPEDGIRKRFGADAHEYYKLARNELYKPIEARPPVESFTSEVALGYPESSTARLLMAIEPRLDDIFELLERKNRLMASITLTLKLDNGETRVEQLTAAAPTDDRRQIMNLIDLRLLKLALPSGIVDISIEAEGVLISHKQLELFRQKPCRETKSADQAFARLRAEFGDNAVMRACLRNGHLPEASYEWEPMEKLTRPSPRKIKARSLVRRIFARSVEFLSWARQTNDAGVLTTTGPVADYPTNARRSKGSQQQSTLQRMSASAFAGALPRKHTGGAGLPSVASAPPTSDQHPRRQDSQVNVIGPYIISGGWWKRRIERDYYYVRSQGGRWLWIYYDRRRRQAFVQGTVE